MAIPAVRPIRRGYWAERRYQHLCTLVRSRWKLYEILSDTADRKPGVRGPDQNGAELQAYLGLLWVIHVGSGMSAIDAVDGSSTGTW